MQLSVIIVNYRASAFIVDCINSAMQFPSWQNFEWIVVDNDSKDGSEQAIIKQFPFVKWIEMGCNSGFAKANNEGIRQAQGEVVLLLNPDTIVTNDAIGRCYTKFIQTNHVACGVQLLYQDGRTQISGSHFMKGGINHLLPLPYWGGLLKTIAKVVGAKKPSIEVATEEEQVDWVSGAFLMVKKNALEKTGLMDEDFFLYAEEVEWCSRLGRVGALYIYGGITMIHLLGEVIKTAADKQDKTYENLFDKKGLQYIVSNHVRIRKQYGVGWYFFQLLNYTLGVPVFLVGSFFDNLFHGKNPFGALPKVVGLAQNVAMVWRLTPTIIRNKSHFYKML